MKPKDLLRNWHRLLVEGGEGSGHFGHGGGEGGPGNPGGSTRDGDSGSGGKKNSLRGTSFDGKYLKFPGGSITSIPRPSDGRAVAFSSSEDILKLRYKKDIGAELYGAFNKFDKTWKDGNSFIKWLNKEGKDFRYDGIDDD